MAERIAVVAPLAGAWIETRERLPARNAFGSRPSRARGLKRLLLLPMAGLSRSRPSRARGLKRPCSPIAHARRSRAPRGRVD